MSANLQDELKEIIENYLDGHRSRSRTTLSRHSGIAYNTITRILQRETIPNLESVIAILKVILPAEEVASFVGKHFPEFGGLLDTLMERHRSVVASPQLEDALRDRLGFFIIGLASRVCGTSKEEVYQSLGSFGLQRLEELIENGTLQEEDERVAINEFIILNPRVLMRSVSHTADFLDDNFNHMRKFHVGWQVEGLNEEGILRAREILKQADLEILELRQKPKFRGETVTYCMSALATFEPPV